MAETNIPVASQNTPSNAPNITPEIEAKAQLDTLKKDIEA
jgi:hypothetical protein